MRNQAAVHFAQIRNPDINHIRTAVEPLWNLRGLADDAAMLCSRNQTFQVKELHTSNTLCLGYHEPASHESNADTSIIIEDTLSSVWELTRVQPKWDRLGRRLMASRVSYQQLKTDSELNEMGVCTEMYFLELSAAKSLIFYGWFNDRYWELVGRNFATRFRRVIKS